MKHREWKKLKNKQYAWFEALFLIWIAFLIAMLAFYKVFPKPVIMSCMEVTGVAGVIFFSVVYSIIGRFYLISKRMEKFIRRNRLCQLHSVKQQGILGEWNMEKIDYYPMIYYRRIPEQNTFCIRIRMDGSPYTERLRDMGEPLARMFHTICTDKIEERGYLTYCFELNRQKQVKIQSCKDIPQVGENEIAFSNDIIWNWKKTQHCLLTGTTGSGKSQLTAYIISCLVKQGVRVIYCDPKNDDDMRLFMQNYPSVEYVTNENDIARVVRETEQEVRAREQDLQNIGIKEAEFNPVYLFFDELIAFSKIAEKKTYEETVKRLASIVVMGRSKRVYTGLILQRPDTSFIEGAIRDNLGCRICMGQMSDTAYKMAFGSDFADVKNLRREIGSGLIYRQGVDTKPREFLAPYIEKGALSRRE